MSLCCVVTQCSDLFGLFILTINLLLKAKNPPISKSVNERIQNNPIAKPDYCTCQHQTTSDFVISVDNRSTNSPKAPKKHRGGQKLLHRKGIKK